MTNRVHTAGAPASLRASLLGRASLAAILAGGAAIPRAVAGSPYASLSQALASAGAAAARTTGNTAAISAGKQAALGIANLQTAAQRFNTLAQALAAQANTTTTQGAAVPNGVAPGGLAPATGYNTAGSGVWLGVSPTAPIVQSTSAGTTNVTITQTSAQAILNWQSFNVGAHTHLTFNQSAGGAAASGWTVLNRIENPTTTPSLIFGSITAPGQVLVLNQAGVLFGAGAQVNLHSLVAGAITLSNQQFLATGIYGTYGTATAPGVAANSAVTVEAGASITTPAATNASSGGGSVILLAANVENDGLIETPGGQTILGGGTYFTLRTGYSVPANSPVTPGVCSTESACSTTLGTEIDASGVGTATNTGLITATTGDITLAGQTVLQGGVLYATTSVSRRGTIHLLSDTTDPTTSITLAPGSLTYIAPDPNSLTANVSERNNTAQTAYGSNANLLLADQAQLTDRPDLSRIEITTGGVVNFADGSLTLANAGQVAVSAVGPAPASKTAPATPGQIFVASGAGIDVSGLNDVVLPMSANTVQVDVQGFQLRDAPVNRDSGTLANLNVTLDTRDLVTVAASVSDNQVRQYTQGGLIEVSGEVAQVQQSIQQWSTVGGSVELASDAVVAQPGSSVNIAGGTIAYQGGTIPQTYLIGPGGAVYNINTAPANLLYTGIYGGDVVDHARWHVTDTYANSLLLPASVYSPGYIEGRDGGTFTLVTPSAVFEGSINAGVQTGPLQTISHATVASGTDPVTIAQDVAPLAGALILADTPNPNASIEVAPSFTTTVQVAADIPTIAATLTAGTPLAASLVNTATFGAGQLSGLGNLTIEVGNATSVNRKGVPIGPTEGSITIDAAINLANGGSLTLAAPSIDIEAPIIAHSGSVLIETENPLSGTPLPVAYLATERGTLTLGAGAAIDTSGLWTNLVTGPGGTAGAAFVNGGNVTLLSDGALTMASGSSIDASAGAVFSPALTGGHGGNITLVADDPSLVDFIDKTGQAANLAPVTLNGSFASLGVSAGGVFSLTVPSIVIGANALPASGLQVALSPSFFASGFSDYVLNGFSAPKGGSASGIVVLPGTAIDVVEPILQATASSLLSPTGTAPGIPLSPTLFPEYLLNPTNLSFRQRAGASLTLGATFAGGPDPQTGSGITIGQGASITVDAGQSVTLQSASQITVDGSIAAPSGTISIQNSASLGDPTAAAKLSIWIGSTATLDVAGQAITGATTAGLPVGEVTAGGSILIGAAGNINDITSFDSAGATIFVRPGAVLDASGAAASIDVLAGTAAAAATAPAGTQASAVQTVGSNGGTIAFASDYGIYLDGTMQAAAGAPGAAGGELAIRLGDPVYAEPTGSNPVLPNWAFTPHQILVSQTTTPTVLPANLTPGDGSFATQNGANGQAAISVQQVSGGGFGTLFLLARDQITFNGNVSLAAAQSITLADFATSETAATGSVAVSAPYVLLAGAPQPSDETAYATPLLSFFNKNGGNAYGNGNPDDSQGFTQKSPCVSGLAACYAATLTVQAGQIDIEGNVGANGAYAAFATSPTTTASTVLNSDGFNAVTLASSGDIRFIPSTDAAGTALANNLSLTADTIYTAGNLTLDAARIYPATGVEATIAAGVNFWGGKDAAGERNRYAANTLYYNGVLTIGGDGAPQPKPLSVFGKLDLIAATIVQGGTLDAPLGQITFGASSSAPPARLSANITATQVLDVTLTPGSVTSVSADGLTVPFGGTTDGTTYSYDGQSLALPGASLGGITSILPSIQFSAPLTNVSAGATVDVSGGGTLTGGGGEILSTTNGTSTLISQGFITGRGGSTDTLTTPFITFSATSLTATVPTLAQEPIYAIVPGFTGAYAPVTALDSTASYYGSVPVAGEQITIGATISGLPAGTYTLLPSYYALLPGAYRVQLGSASTIAGTAPRLTGSSLSLGNGTVQSTGTLGFAGTGIENPTPTTVYLTSGTTVRDDSQYDEEGYAAYGVANAALFGNPRPYLPQDAGAVLVSLAQIETTFGRTASVAATSGFVFDGTALTAPAAGGYGAALVITPAAATGLDVLGAGDVGKAGDVAVTAAAIQAVGAADLFLGNSFAVPSASISIPNAGGATSVSVGAGAALSADAVFILATNITVDAGASISSIGQAASLPDSSTGVLFSPNIAAAAPGTPATADAVLAIANGEFLFPAGAVGKSSITLGACATSAPCTGTVTNLFSGGFLGLLSGGVTSIASNVNFGAASLELDSSTLTIGTPPTGTSTTGSTTTTAGTVLTQGLLNQLVAGDAALGVPALNTLQLIAGTAIDFTGTASLNTINPTTGLSTLGTLVIATPAFYGSGTAGETASITTGTLVWNGIASSSTAPITLPTNGFGAGQGTLAIAAQQIVIGYPAQAQAQNNTTIGHLALGFADVELTATNDFTANNHATLAVYEAATNSGSGTVTGSTSGSLTLFTGGNLTIVTPLLTTAPGAVLGITAGGTLNLAGAAAGSGTPATGGLGGEIDFSAATIIDSTRIALPSGKVTADATGSPSALSATAGGITLEPGAAIDLAGPTITIIDQQIGSFGGTLDLTSQQGNITEAAGASIDISATGANAGTLSATARAGTVSLLGSLFAAAPQNFDAGSVGITASTLGNFAALNTLFDAAGANFARSFEQVGAGNLTVGAVTAQNITIAVDQGSLTVAGTIDASGVAPGTINLAATGDLTLASTAVLQAQETTTHTDSFGNIIASENTPHIELQVASNTVNPGTLTIASGATIDMAGPQNLAFGVIELDVPRSATIVGDANIEATGSIAIAGAAEIDVNAFRTYVAGTGPVATGTITQGTMNAINADSLAFMDAAVTSGPNGGTLAGPLAGQLAGLAQADTGALHLRPGVEIDSSAASAGDLTVSQIVDLSAYRYASIDPNTNQYSASLYGSGEPGVLWLRATDTLAIDGNITDGFAPPPSGQPATVALRQLLAAGDLSWSIRLVAGADLAAADSRAVIAPDIAGSAAAIGIGNLTLSNLKINGRGDYNESVVRTGTGYLDLYAGGNFSEGSPYGIYTAGTAIAAATPVAGENFTTGGGDVTVVADGTASGYVANTQTPSGTVLYSNTVDNWLVENGKSWGIDFGSIRHQSIYAVNGFGTFGGGNVDVTVGGNAGTIAPIELKSPVEYAGGLDITVATTGYVDAATGSLVVSGGGDVRLDVGGTLNPVVKQAGPGPAFDQNAFGEITDLRGKVAINAGSIGQVDLVYQQNTNDPRAVDPFVAETYNAFGGPTLVLGDAQAGIATRGDLVLGGVGDGGGLTFSFYQPATAVRLFSAGGNLVPTTTAGSTIQQGNVSEGNTNADDTSGVDDGTTTFFYAPTLIAVAGSGSIYLAGNGAAVELAPSAQGSLSLLAAGSIYDGGSTASGGLTNGLTTLDISMSGAGTVAASPLPGMLFPVQTSVQQNPTLTVAETASGTLHDGDQQAALFYAASGDIVGLQTGAVIAVPGQATDYIGATAVQIVAGRDVVGTGGPTASISVNGTVTTTSGNPDFFLDNNAGDISLVQAGRDIIYANVDVAGPGVLTLQAGRNIYQGDKGILLSLGEVGSALTSLTREDGAGITVLAGVGGTGFNAAGFAALYLNAANLANPATPLQDQPGKVERTYQEQLYTWLAARGYTGTQADALAYFLALPQAEQTVFLLTVYFAELNQSGLDYNNPQSRFYHSYLEGQEAIRTLFPNTDLTGQAPPSGGSLTLFSGEQTILGTVNLYDSAIRTEFGGAITTLVPYGQTLLGTYGIVPQATAGLITQGSGDIDMYSYGSVTLGQSRVLTTLGGNILIWMSSDGVINAGRGSKTTSITPPDSISYDIYGNIFLSPTVPSSGAGIGALAPIAGIPAGDVNLIAPVGSIDAGEAGIRASGNVNVAALTVVNAANIQSGGKTSGVPTVSSPSAAAAAAASSTSGQAASASQQAVGQRAPAPEPSVIEVEVLVGGGDAGPDEERRRKRKGGA